MMAGKERFEPHLLFLALLPLLSLPVLSHPLSLISPCLRLNLPHRHALLDDVDDALHLLARQRREVRAELAALLKAHHAPRLARAERAGRRAVARVFRADKVPERLAAVLELRREVAAAAAAAQQRRRRRVVAARLERLERELLALQLHRPRLLELQRPPRLLEELAHRERREADGVRAAVVEHRVVPDQPHVGGKLAGLGVRARLELLADRLQVHRRLDD